MSKEKASANESSKPSQGNTPIQGAEPVNTFEAQAYTEKHFKNGDSEMNDFQKSSLVWTKITSLIYACTLLGILLQWCVMRDQLNKMEEALTIQRRTAIWSSGPPDMEINWIAVFPTTNLGQVQVRIDTKNTGNTDAESVRMAVNANFLKSFDWNQSCNSFSLKDFKPLVDHLHKATQIGQSIAPLGTRNITISVPTNTKGESLYVCGIVQYLNVASQPETDVPFCRKFEAGKVLQSMQMNKVHDGPFTYCSQSQ